MKRFFLGLLALLLIGIPAALIAAAWLALDDQPAVVRKVELTHQQIARARAIAKGHDPRAGFGLRSMTLTAQDVDLAANYFLASQGGGAKVALNAGAAMLWVTVPAPPNPFGRYLNVEAVLSQTSALPEFDRLSIGRLPVPGIVADRLLAHALERASALSGSGEAADLLESVRFDGEHVQIVYRWREDMPQRLRAALLPEPEQERLRFYQQRLTEISADARLPQQVSLHRVLEPLMAHAAERSGEDPAAENRAALVVLAFYVNGRGLTAVVPQAREWPRPVARRVTLGGRRDLAQHFSVSAALAANAGCPLADAIGLYKEVEDARGGSGFSFPDLAADRAGSVFGTQATRSAAAARTLQQRVRAGAVEADFMPDTTGLPEGMKESEFTRRFGGVGQPAYQRMEAEIERRIGALALYR